MADLSTPEDFDDIDDQLLDILADDPRMPYSDIARELADAGYDMSTEGVRYRVSKILDATTVFFLLNPEEYPWEIFRIAVSATDDPDAKREAYDLLTDLPFWNVARGLGSYDIYAVGSARSLADVDRILTYLRERSPIDSVEYIVVTERNRDMSRYVSWERVDFDGARASAGDVDGND
ncbi:MAG: Lrp/AsnC family transcriptional regulator [Haloferacaceae archaeon]